MFLILSEHSQDTCNWPFWPLFYNMYSSSYIYWFNGHI